MATWTASCELLLQFLGNLTIERSELQEAVESGDADAAVLALGPVLLRLDGAYQVLQGCGSERLKNWGQLLLDEIVLARKLGLQAFEEASAASGMLIVAEGVVCPIDF